MPPASEGLSEPSRPGRFMGEVVVSKLPLPRFSVRSARAAPPLGSPARGYAFTEEESLEGHFRWFFARMRAVSSYRGAWPRWAIVSLVSSALVGVLAVTKDLGSQLQCKMGALGMISGEANPARQLPSQGYSGLGSDSQWGFCVTRRMGSGSRPPSHPSSVTCFPPRISGRAPHSV